MINEVGKKKCCHEQAYITYAFFGGEYCVIFPLWAFNRYLDENQRSLTAKSVFNETANN